MSRGRWRRVLGGGLVLAAAVFLAVTIAGHWAQLEAFEWRLRWGLLIVSVPGLTAVLAWGVYVWKLVLDCFDHPPVSFAVLLRIWFLSNLARYIPGKVWQLVGAAELARLAGLSRALVLTAMVVHVAFSLLAAAVLSAVVLAPDGLAWPFSLVTLVAATTAAIVLVHPAVLDGTLRLVARGLDRPVLRWRGRWLDGLGILALSVASWVMYGLVFATFVAAVVPIGPAAVLPLAAINALSFLVGYLVFLAPAGLGAREGAMAILLRPIAPAGVAAVVAVLARLWTVAGELLGAVLVLAADRLRARGTAPR